MSQPVKIRSGQVVKLELNDSCVNTLAAAWQKFQAYHTEIHGCEIGYSEFISRLIVMAAEEVNRADDAKVNELLMIRIFQQIEVTQ